MFLFSSLYSKLKRRSTVGGASASERVSEAASKKAAVQQSLSLPASDARQQQQQSPQQQQQSPPQQQQSQQQQQQSQQFASTQPPPPQQQPTSSEGAAPRPLPPGMPKPLWANRAPPSPSASTEPAPPPLPPGMPKPLWANRAPPSSGAEPTPAPGMPKPMWSNRAPPPSRSGGSNDSISDSAQPVFRSLTLPGDADLAHGTSNASLLNSSGGSAATLDLATGAAVGTGNARGSAAASCSTPTPTLPAVRMRSETGPLGEELRRKVLQGTEYQYEMRELLGRGSYAKVKLCRALETDATFAVKIFKVSLLKRRRMWDSQVVGFKTAFDDVLREIAIMKCDRRRRRRRAASASHAVLRAP